MSGNTMAGNIVYSGAHRAPQVYPTPSPYCTPQPAFLPPSLQVGRSAASVKIQNSRFPSRLLCVISASWVTGNQKEVLAHCCLKFLGFENTIVDTVREWFDEPIWGNNNGITYSYKKHGI